MRENIYANRFYMYHSIAHKKITESIPKQFRFGNSSIEIPKFPKQFGKQLRNPLLTPLTETN